MDDDPTHYVDINLSKDGKCLFINSSTKEDNEIWVLREGETVPKLLIKRKANQRVHIDHLRDFYIRISNEENSGFKLLTLCDTELGQKEGTEQF